MLSVAWSPDGKRLATGSVDQTAKVWDAASGREVLTLHAHNRPVTSVAWSPDGNQLATGSVDQTAKVWDATSGREVLTLRAHNKPVTSVAWSRTGSSSPPGVWTTQGRYGTRPPDRNWRPSEAIRTRYRA